MGGPARTTQDHFRTKDHPQEEAMIEEPFPWEKRLESAMAAYALKRTKRNRERAEMAERRAYGLMQRHAAKLASNRAESKQD